MQPRPSISPLELISHTNKQTVACNVGFVKSIRCMLRFVFWAHCAMIRSISLFSLLLITTLAIAGSKDDPLFEIKGEIRVKFPTVEHVSVEQLRDKLAPTVKQPPLLLDVREPEEYSVSHIHGAKLTTKIEQVMAILDQQSKDRITILYCSVGYRSAVFVKQLQQRGYKHIFNLEGSIFEWANKGYPLYQGEKPVSVVHPYNFWWGRLLDDKLHADY
jgi:rhodanese-related sulfurtransferase